MGRILENTGKFGKLSQIVFPEKEAQVRNFIRLVARTPITASEAARLSGGQLTDLSTEYDAAIHAPATVRSLTSFTRKAGLGRYFSSPSIKV